MTQNNLGNAWSDLPSGNRDENLRQAIACYEAALRVRTETDFPQDWATTQNNLGNAWSNLPSGNRDANLRQAIACYEAALRVSTETTFRRTGRRPRTIWALPGAICRAAIGMRTCAKRSPAMKQPCASVPRPIFRRTGRRRRTIWALPGAICRAAIGRGTCAKRSPAMKRPCAFIPRPIFRVSTSSWLKILI